MISLSNPDTVAIVQEPGYPDEATIASIQHQAEKLGYLVAQVETLFDQRVRWERHRETVRHSTKSTGDLSEWMTAQISSEELAERAAVLLQETSDKYDHIKANYQHNINTLNQMVLDSINRGKSQANELDETLSEILKEGK